MVELEALSAVVKKLQDTVADHAVEIQKWKDCQLRQQPPSEMHIQAAVLDRVQEQMHEANAKVPELYKKQIVVVAVPSCFDLSEFFKFVKGGS